MSCEEEDCSHNSFDIESEITNTISNCTIGPNTTSTQDTKLTFYQRSPVYVDVFVKSQDGYVEYDDSGQDNDQKTQKKLRPAKINNPTEETFSFDFSQDGSDQNDTLESYIEFYDNKGCDDDNKNDTVPSVYPKVDLS